VSPWWLRPPADEPVGDENSTAPNQDGGAGKSTGSDGAAVDSPRQRTTTEDPSGTPPSDQGKQGSQRPSRRRPRGGQARRPGRESEGTSAAPAAARPRKRSRRTAPASKNAGVNMKTAVSGGPRDETEVAARPQARPSLEDRRLAVICDLESIALGEPETGTGHFDIGLVLERLLDKGKIIIKRAYADWERQREVKGSFHQAGMELFDIPRRQHSGTSEADIKIAVDAMELCFSKQHLDTFVLISGDGDLTPLVAKLRGNNKHVIGVGSRGSSSQVLIDNCDEFLFYEDMLRQAQEPPQPGESNEDRAEVFTLMVEAIEALMRENHQILWGSVIKQAIQRQHPSFKESRYGFSSFSKVLEEAEENGIIKLKKDQRSGSYVVTGFARS